MSQDKSHIGVCGTSNPQMGEQNVIVFVMETVVLFYSSSYQGEILDESDILNETITYAYYHLAILDLNRLPLLVSCVTLEPPYKVPPGKQYAVSSIS